MESSKLSFTETWRGKWSGLERRLFKCPKCQRQSEGGEFRQFSCCCSVRWLNSLSLSLVEKESLSSLVRAFGREWARLEGDERDVGQCLAEVSGERVLMMIKCSEYFIIQFWICPVLCHSSLLIPWNHFKAHPVLFCLTFLSLFLFVWMTRRKNDGEFEWNSLMPAKFPFVEFYSRLTDSLMFWTEKALFLIEFFFFLMKQTQNENEIVLKRRFIPFQQTSEFKNTMDTWKMEYEMKTILCKRFYDFMRRFGKSNGYKSGF